MAHPPLSQARRTLRRQVGMAWGALQVLWLGLAAVIVWPLLDRLSVAERLALPLLCGLATLLIWQLGRRTVDRLVGPTLDRIAQLAQAIAPLDRRTGQLLPALVSESPQATLGQLAVRLEDSQAELTAQVQQLSRLNLELAAAREELLRAERLAVVGRLSAGVAHEVGNPLGALIGFLGLAKAAADDASREEALAGVEAQAQRIHRTVQELMDFARAGKMEMTAIALAPTIEIAARLVAAHPRWRQMRLAVELRPGLTDVRASAHHLVQVWVNLFLNAADACQGGGQISVVGEMGERSLRLEVSDDGPGISAGDEERIFEPFVSSKPVGQGSGLGLAISRQIIESFGGRIRALPSARGAHFAIDLLAAEVGP